jgi:unsaturated rhamnogalacturonyl hydrolase
MKDVRVGQVNEAVVRVNFLYGEGDVGPYDLIVRNVEVRNLTCEKSQYALYMKGYERSPIRNISLIDCRFDNIAKPNILEHVQGLVLNNVTINGEAFNTPKPDEESLSVRMADSVLSRNPDCWTMDFRDEPKWTYTQGLVMKALWQVWEKTQDDKYLQYIKLYYDSMIADDGSIKTYKLTDYNIDKINSGKALLTLYKHDGQSKYKKALDLLRQQMKTHPRTSEGGFWHKKRYPHQMWLDGIYMASPFLAHYAIEFNEPVLLDDVAKQIILIERHTRDAQTGLLYHAWDESRQQRWADPNTGRSPHFWGRAMGWYAMALVDVLDFLPQDHSKRPETIAIMDRLFAALAKYQDPRTGVWYQVVDLASREGNYLEATVSCMTVYAMAKAVRLGYVDAKYLDVARKGYQGILDTFITTDDKGLLNINQCCSVGGLGGDPYRDGSFEYYMSEPVRSNDPKGIGPFILASLEFE